MDRNKCNDIMMDEKAELLPQQVRFEIPERRKTRKANFGLGVVVASVMFLWWSLYAIPSLLSIGNDGEGKDERELGFDEVSKIDLSDKSM
jgi:hypothetical protein